MGVPHEKPLLNPIHSPVPTTPLGSASPDPVGHHYLNGPEAEAIKQGSSQQASGEAEDRSERAGSSCEQGEVGKKPSSALWVSPIHHVPLILNSHKISLPQAALRVSSILG